MINRNFNHLSNDRLSEFTHGLKFELENISCVSQNDKDKTHKKISKKRKKLLKKTSLWQIEKKSLLLKL